LPSSNEQGTDPVETPRQGSDFPASRNKGIGIFDAPALFSTAQIAWESAFRYPSIFDGPRPNP
jgi:hypothetical protein